MLPIGIAAAGAWRYAFIYEVLPRWLPSVAEQARQLSQQQARRAILSQYIHNVVATSPAEAARALGWTVAEALRTATELAAEGQVQLDVKVRGIGEKQWLTASF